ncbi:isomerase [Niveispirillum lacus]|uniref:Isomerase n=1 Tax=Niveispirillum lacus TaxID=1981099 RepID=A0A255YWX3_9PROT|nr:PhzF family phenazine biosynthesis protein [Niveispirillum lacus]OYQ33698.1 isomerase [Niveispirillum lacus]
MRLPIYQVDAFADHLFAGNPAAVVPLEHWLPDAVMQSIAAENNLAETAFIRRDADGWFIRWFTPANEIDLCGHATLASAFVIRHFIEPDCAELRFQTKVAGELRVLFADGVYILDFPTRAPVAVPVHPDLVRALGGPVPEQVLAARDWLVVYPDEATVRSLSPDFSLLNTVGRMVIVTAPGSDGVDFVSRFFAPMDGIPEDPVTGSAHCTLTPYWAQRLGKERLNARQVSARGGTLRCQLLGNRVHIAGQAVLYLEGFIHV